MDEIVGFVVMLGVPGYFLLQFVMWLGLRGRWCSAALFPLIFAVPVAIWCLVALTQESNLWPLPFILFAPLGTAYLLVLALVRFVASSRG
jgi:hypothetical protein